MLDNTGWSSSLTLDVSSFVTDSLIGLSDGNSLKSSSV